MAWLNMAVPTSFPRECGEPTRAGVLTYQPGADSQLRDSTGLTPVSPLSLPIRGLRHPDRYSIIFVLYARPQEKSTFQDFFRWICPACLPLDPRAPARNVPAIGLDRGQGSAIGTQPPRGAVPAVPHISRCTGNQDQVSFLHGSVHRL